MYILVSHTHYIISLRKLCHSRSSISAIHKECMLELQSIDYQKESNTSEKGKFKEITEKKLVISTVAL